MDLLSHAKLRQVVLGTLTEFVSASLQLWLPFQAGKTAMGNCPLKIEIFQLASCVTEWHTPICCHGFPLVSANSLRHI